MWVYGQTEVQKDLVAGPDGGRPAGLLRGRRHRPARRDSDRPSRDLHCRRPGRGRLVADAVAGCDGSFGPSRGAVPEPVRQPWERPYPYSWLGILANVAPSTDELIYAWHPDGFALHSMRSATVSAASTCRCPTTTDLGRVVRRPDLGRRSPTRLGHGQDGWR